MKIEKCNYYKNRKGQVVYIMDFDGEYFLDDDFMSYDKEGRAIYVGYEYDLVEETDY